MEENNKQENAKEEEDEKKAEKQQENIEEQNEEDEKKKQKEKNKKSSKKIEKQKEIESLKPSEEISKLKKKNLHKSILIVILVILLTGTSILAYPTAKRYIKKEITKIQLAESYNSKHKLNLVSEYGDIEAYHPKVLSFNPPWNGYRYWMSFTPYPSSDATKENPHVVASNDMLHWQYPSGERKALDTVMGATQKIYNSDSHIVMNDDLNRLECFWRYVNDEKNQVIIYRKYTTDGIHWSEKEKVMESKDRRKKDFVSPAILYNKGTYQIWYVDQNRTLKYVEAKEGEEWINSKTIKIDYPKELESWHLDVIKTDLGYEMVMMAFENWKERGNASLYYSVSQDNITWSKCTEIIKPSKETDYWDNRGIYRSSVLKEEGIYYVFYSAANVKNIKGIGIMYGKDINNLHKLDIDYKNDKDAVKKFNRLIEIEKKR